MDLRDYPRPKDDTGIGVHWSAGYPAVMGLGQIQDTWLPELIALGVKWVKLARADGGTAFDELLLRNGIFPIVRLYRPQPNPGTLDETQVRLLKEHVAAGVRYFEFNNEPDLANEWQGGQTPPDALQIVARNAIQDIETILAAGGMPAIPALTVGSRWDLVKEICRQGRRDLLRAGVWQAVHNYSINHPVDYPYDAGNQDGAPYTADFYSLIAAERWDKDAWGGMSLAQVNQQRQRDANPGKTVLDDASCWLAYERYDALIRAQIGRSLPVLGTEDGYIVGERPDARYPATTPQLHAAQTIETCRTLMGTSTRYRRAPDWFFCSAYWLVGNYTLGHYAAEWENAAWYSARWPGGHLPVIEALKAEPKQARQWHGDGGRAGEVKGAVTNGGGFSLRLTGSEDWTATTAVKADGRYEFADVPAGRYRLTVAEAPQCSQEVALSADQLTATVDLDLSGAEIRHEESVVQGIIRGGAGMTVQLGRPADGWNLVRTAEADGSFRFGGLAAGTYVLVLVGTEAARAGIVLDGQNEVTVELAAPGWGWQVSDGGGSPGFAIVRCRTEGTPSVTLHLWAAGWQGMTQRTGSKAEYGTDACEFAPLGAGTYYVQPEGGNIGGVPAPRATVTVDGRCVAWVTFTRPPVARPESVIAGYVHGGEGRPLTLVGPDGEQQTRVAADGSYQFTGLRSGIYRVEVPGSDAAQDGIILDGQNRITVDLTVTPPQKTEQPPESQDGTDEQTKPGTEGGPGKKLEYYLLLGNLVRTKYDFLAALRYVARFQPVVGSSEAEARQALHVTILGNTNSVSPHIEQGLRDAGCQVQRIEGDYAGALEKLLAAGRPY